MTDFPHDGDGIDTAIRAKRAAMTPTHTTQAGLRARDCKHMRYRKTGIDTWFCDECNEYLSCEPCAHSAPQETAPAAEPVEGDRLPKGHVVLEQSEMPDGRVSQTVRAANGVEYERIVHADEAYGEEK